MKTDAFEVHLKKILETLDGAIASGPWTQSNFLKSIEQDLKNLREKIVAYDDVPHHDALLHSDDVILSQQLTGEQDVFIGLYCSDGSNLASWEKIINNLPKHVVSRPVYEHEESMKQIIRMKENKKNEAYVGVMIKKSDIIALDVNKVPMDKLGQPLLTIKDSAIHLENIKFFVYNSVKYNFKQGKLVKAI